MGDDGGVEFEVEAPGDGFYAAKIRYRTGPSDKEQRLLVNGAPSRPALGFRATSGRWDDATFLVALRKGRNSVQIEKSWGQTDFDYLELAADPVDGPAEIHPKRNTFFRGAAWSLRYKLDPRGKTLAGISVDGRPVPHWTEILMYDHAGGAQSRVLDGEHWVVLEPDALEALPDGTNPLRAEFSDGTSLGFELQVSPRPEQRTHPLDLVIFDVDHGVSVLYLLPDGRSILFDTGQSWAFERRVLPFLHANGIRPSELWISHRHGDHDGGEQRFRSEFPEAEVHDNRSSRFAHGGEIWLAGVRFKVLNTWGDGCYADGYCDENPNSLVTVMEFQGFRMNHQSDVYAADQDRMLREWGRDENRADVMLANHHFHGSVSSNYLEAVDAALYLVSANPVVHGRGAYTQDAARALDRLRKSRSHFREALLSFDVGHTIIRVHSGADWTYETTFKKELDSGESPDLLVVPGLR